MVDDVYASPYMTLLLGLLVAAVIVVVDELDLCFTEHFWGATCMAFFVTAMLHKSNPSATFMVGCLVAELASARRRLATRDHA